MSRSSEIIVDAVLNQLEASGAWTNLAAIGDGVMAPLGRKRLTEKLLLQILEELRELTEEGILLSRVDKAGLPEYVVHGAFFEGKRLLVRLTQFEEERHLLVAGHRFVPFVTPCIAPNETTVLFRGQELPRIDIRMPLEDSELYCTLLGKGGWLEYVALQNGGDALIEAMKCNGEVQLTAYDLRGVLEGAGETTTFVVQATDYERGVVEIVSSRGKDAPVDFAATTTACRALDSTLEAVFDEWGPESLVLPVQIALAYAQMPESFFKEPPFAFGAYLQMSKKVTVAKSFINTVLWHTGQDPRDAIDPEERRLIETMLGILDDELHEDAPGHHTPPVGGREAPQPADRGKRRASRGGQVFTVRVALDGNTRIYRDIEIHENDTWSDLHEAIFNAFERDDEHLYAFYLTGKACPSIPQRYRSPTIGPDAMREGLPRDRDAAHALIGAAGLKVKDALYYLFDFGDEWWHKLTVMSVEERPDAVPSDFPRIVKVVGDSPPQYPEIDEE